MKLCFDVLSKTIGIKECTAPQISEHCPKKIPGWLINRLTWLIRPGFASTLIPKEGIVQEWRTSAAEIKIRVCVLKGIINRLFTSKSRKSLIFISLVGII